MRSVSDSAAGEVVILCEGYDDRAFLSGYLLHARGCRDLSVGNDGRRLPFVVSPRGDRVLRGEYAFSSKGGRFVRIVPCQGVDGVFRKARMDLADLGRAPLHRLIVVLDDDGDVSTSAGSNRARAEALVAGQGGVSDALEAALTPTGGALATVLWCSHDPPSERLPAKQALERIVCASLAAVYPDRAAAVASWLGSRPQAPPDHPHKSFAWSFMAGWYPDHGCEAFFSTLWTDPAVRAELESRVTACGLAAALREID